MKEILLMSKNILRWFWYLPAAAALYVVAVMLYPPIVFSDTLYIVCEYAAVEALVIVVVLSVLRKLNMLASWKLIGYFVFVVAGSLAVNLLLSPIGGENLLPFIFSVFALFVFLNLGLLEVIFVISFWKACLISIIAGLINVLMIIHTGIYSH